MNRQPDLLIVNAKVWTGEAAMPMADGVAIGGETIFAVGSMRELLALRGPNTRVLDVDGKMILPGFIDNHTHLFTGGFQLLSLDLSQAADKEEFIAAVAAYVEKTPARKWVTGGGWNNDLWIDRRLPVKEWIDSFTPQTPVFLFRSDLHIAFANSAALLAAGIGRDSANPPGGEMDRDPYTGELTGILKDNAVNLVQSCIPAPAAAEYNAALLTAMRYAAQMGVTSVQDITAWRDGREWETVWDWQRQNKLSLRIYARTPIAEWEKQAQFMAEGFHADHWLRLGGVKGFVDGSLGSGTALMFAPYEDAPECYGLLSDQMVPEGMMAERITAADGADLPVSIHAIGDRANHLLLDIYEQVIRKNGMRDRRLRIEHVQHITPEDVSRMARLGILASVQPAHLYQDGCWAAKRIGWERCRTTYAFRSLLAANIALSFGTDWPVVPLNPFLGIQAAVTRQTQDGKNPDGWMPEQKLPVSACLTAYTAGSAYAEFAEDIKGTIAPGKLADLIVVSQDVFTAPPAELAKTRVLLTIAGGKVIFEG